MKCLPNRLVSIQINSIKFPYAMLFEFHFLFAFLIFRMSVDRKGNLCYSHSRDPTWDVNEYLIELKKDLQKWRDVYWRVWGSINYLTCSRCGETFPGTHLGHCRYHSEPAGFESGLIGEYPCCGLKTLRFDPTLPNRVGASCFNFLTDRWICNHNIVLVRYWEFSFSILKPGM